MTTRYFDRPALDMKRKKHREYDARYRLKHRDALLVKKRLYACKPETLARRRHRYLHRNDPKQPPIPPSKPVTLDKWARREAPKRPTNEESPNDQSGYIPPKQSKLPTEDTEDRNLNMERDKKDLTE